MPCEGVHLFQLRFGVLDVGGMALFFRVCYWCWRWVRGMVLTVEDLSLGGILMVYIGVLVLFWARMDGDM